MAARTTEAAVKVLLGTNYDTARSPSLTSVMGMAMRLVDWLQSKDVDAELTADTLADIECNLAAHFYQDRDKGFQSKSTGGASATFQGQTGQGLASSNYGQTAMVMDLTGYLAQRNQDMVKGRQRMVVSWGGKTETEQLDYKERN